MNDRSPVFSQNIYNASVAENRDPGEPVVRVSATDDDSGKNGQNITMETKEKCNFFSDLRKIVFLYITSFKVCGAFFMFYVYALKYTVHEKCM